MPDESRMRVLMVSPAYPPDRCGVGDYTCHLAERLARRGRVQLGVLTASPQAQRESEGPELLHASHGRVSAGALSGAIRAFRPDLVHIQYPTRRDISPFVPFLARRIHRLPVVQTWHEHYSECGLVTPANLLGLDVLIHVRADLPARLPPRIARCLAGRPVLHIPNGRTIPAVVMSAAEREDERRRLSGGRPIVAFLGFAYPNKGAHLLFEIADPERHHLLFVGELDPGNDYQRAILETSRSGPWAGHVTSTGYLPAVEAGRMLAACDAAVFPFPDGVGDWNTSVNAALASGTLVLATARDEARHGYDAERNLLLAPCGDVGALRAGLAAHLGSRRAARPHDDWEDIAAQHEKVYANIL